MITSDPTSPASRSTALLGFDYANSTGLEIHSAAMESKHGIFVVSAIEFFFSTARLTCSCEAGKEATRAPQVATAETKRQGRLAARQW